MKTDKIYSTLIIFLIIIFSLSCSGDKNIPLEEKLQNALDNGIKKYDVRGVSAALILPGKKMDRY